jgi:hypothetical protein
MFGCGSKMEETWTVCGVGLENSFGSFGEGRNSEEKDLFGGENRASFLCSVGFLISVSLSTSRGRILSNNVESFTCESSL